MRHQPKGTGQLSRVFAIWILAAIGSAGLAGCGSNAPSCFGSDIDTATRARLKEVMRAYEALSPGVRKAVDELWSSRRAALAGLGYSLPEQKEELAFFSTRILAVDDVALSCDCVGHIDALSHPSAVLAVVLPAALDAERFEPGVDPMKFLQTVIEVKNLVNSADPSLGLVDGVALLDVPFRAQYDSRGRILLDMEFDSSYEADSWSRGYP